MRALHAEGMPSKHAQEMEGEGLCKCEHAGAIVQQERIKELAREVRDCKQTRANMREDRQVPCSREDRQVPCLRGGGLRAPP